jgi:hypothetical protein
MYISLYVTATGSDKSLQTSYSSDFRITTSFELCACKLIPYWNFTYHINYEKNADHWEALDLA